jgi:hypothetical protein
MNWGFIVRPGRGADASRSSTVSNAATCGMPQLSQLSQESQGSRDRMHEVSRAHHGVSLEATRATRYNFCSDSPWSLKDATEAALRRPH